MRLILERLPRLLLPLGVAFIVGSLLHDLAGISRAWCIPAGLFAAVQLQKSGLI